MTENSKLYVWSCEEQVFVFEKRHEINKSIDDYLMNWNDGLF